MDILRQIAVREPLKLNGLRFRSLFTRREELTKTVQTGAVELADMRRRTLARREALARELDHLHRRLDQLRADAAVV
jgi:uncharacterized protein Yka (UPF0111/DUF47 family)